MNVNTGEAGYYKKLRQDLELAQLWSWDNLELLVLPLVLGLLGLLAYTTTPGLSGAGDKQGSACSASKHHANRRALEYVIPRLHCHLEIIISDLDLISCSKQGWHFCNLFAWGTGVTGKLTPDLGSPFVWSVTAWLPLCACEHSAHNLSQTWPQAVLIWAACQLRSPQITSGGCSTSTSSNRISPKFCQQPPDGIEGLWLSTLSHIIINVFCTQPSHTKVIFV